MCHVLVIEDNLLVARAIQLTLAEVGATSFDMVDTADDAVWAALHRTPDIITSDCELRVGTGPDAVREIHRMRGVIPVLFITANQLDFDMAGWAELLIKPVTAQRVSDSFRRLRAPLPR